MIELKLSINVLLSKWTNYIQHISQENGYEQARRYHL